MTISSRSNSSNTLEMVASRPPNSAIFYEPARKMTPYVTLGPIIGLVTATSARVLIETSHSTSVSCFLTDKRGKQFGVKRHFDKGLPAVFQFAGLQPETKYRVSFDVPVPGLVKAGFHTIPDCWDIKHRPARFACVSSNEHCALRDHVEERSDLWKKLYKQASRDQIDYIFHLGDNVYLDSNYSKIVKGKKYNATEEEDCKWMTARRLLSEKPPDQWGKSFHQVCDIFRSAYRQSWSHPTTRHAMANAPNLMILNQHEIRTNLGVDECDPHSLDFFLSKCAYEVYNEYQRSLFEDYSCGNSTKDCLAVGQAYHFHCLGDIGIMFLDSVANPLFHHRDDANPLFGSRQWKDIDFALRTDGYLYHCKMLIVLCPNAPAWVGDGPASFHHEKQGVNCLWSSTKNVPETSLLLCRLYDWRAERPGRREVCIVAGDVHRGSTRTITDLRYNHGHLGQMIQFTASPMATIKVHRPISSSGANHVGAYHRFSRGKNTCHANFLTLEVYSERDSKFLEAGSATIFEGHHVTSG